MTTLYHMTTAAEADRIRSGGFRDATTDYGDGVLLAEEPLAWRALGGSPEYDTTVQVLLDIPEEKLAAYAVELAAYAVEEDGGGPRRWLIPAAVVNGRGNVLVLLSYEVFAPLSGWQRWRAEDPEDPEGDDPEKWVRRMVSADEGFLRARVRDGTSVIAEAQGVADREYLAKVMRTRTLLAARRRHP